MDKKSVDQPEHKNSPHTQEVPSASQGDKSSSPGSPRFRTDRLPGSHAIPANQKIYQRMNITLIVGLLIILLILILIWYVLAGAGRPGLEQKLVKLLPTSTSTPIGHSIDPSPPTDFIYTPPRNSSPTKTATVTRTTSPTHTQRPSSTPTITKTATWTPVPLSATPTMSPTPACWDATQITLAEVGKTLCVQGIVIETVEKTNSFLMAFSNKKGAAYWVSYDMVLSKIDLGTCYRVIGTIQQLGNSPILVFNYSNIPEVCP